MYFDYGVFGGDKRQIHVAGRLVEKGYSVCVYGLTVDSSCRVERRFTVCESFCELMTGARTVIGPIPLMEDKEHVNCRFQDEVTVGSIVEGAWEKQRFYAGCIPEDMKVQMKKKGVCCTDLMKDEALTVYNSIATAEGAIAEAILSSPLNIHKSRCLVVGYGRCGRTIAQLLKGMLCHVTVCECEERGRAEAAIRVDEAIDWHGFYARSKTFDFIFNTVPSQVFDRRTLVRLNRNVIMIDIASAPGGIDYNAARKMGISALHCLGLPGKYSPESSARAIVDMICAS